MWKNKKALWIIKYEYFMIILCINFSGKKQIIFYSNNIEFERWEEYQVDRENGEYFWIIILWRFHCFLRVFPQGFCGGCLVELSLDFWRNSIHRSLKHYSKNSIPSKSHQRPNMAKNKIHSGNILLEKMKKRIYFEFIKYLLCLFVK